MSTPHHRADAVETSSRAPVSARLPATDTPIYDRLVWELTTGWPVAEPDSPTVPELDPPTLPTVQLDQWFEEWSEVTHTDNPNRSLFRQAMVGAK